LFLLEKGFAVLEKPVEVQSVPEWNTEVNLGRHNVAHLTQ